jgi:hypothetical protein
MAREVQVAGGAVVGVEGVGAVEALKGGVAAEEEGVGEVGA